MKVAVIGAGHQGLVGALILARAGAEVTVFEQATQAGGCVWSEQRGQVLVERGAWEHGGIVELAESLGLEAYGLHYREHSLLSATRFGDGEQRLFATDLEQTVAGLGADADRYRQFAELAGSLFDMLDAFATPPTLTEVAATLSPLRGGDRLFRTLLRPAQVVIAEAVRDPHTRAALELYAAHGQIPPWAPGSGMFGLLLPAGHGGRAARPVGGSGALTAALVGALEAAGGRLLLGQAVTQIRPQPQGAVVCTAEDQLRVDRVLSSIDVRRLARLVPELPAELAGELGALHSGHFNISELTVSLSYRIAPLLPLDADRDAVWFTQKAPSDLGVGLAEVLAGQLPSRPSAMVGQVDQGPGTGGAVWLSSVVPLQRNDGAWSTTTEQEAGTRVVDAVSEILDCDLWQGLDEIVVSGPLTWGARLASDGNPNHLDLSIDQLLGWRPGGLDRWQQRYPWLSWCGAGVHPGGGLSGASGVAAAEAILAGNHALRRTNELVGLWQAFGAYRQLRKK